MSRPLPANKNLPPPARGELIRAIQQFNQELVKDLLDRGADPNERDYNGQEARYIASQYGQWDVVKMLDAASEKKRQQIEAEQKKRVEKERQEKNAVIAQKQIEILRQKRPPKPTLKKPSGP